MTPMLERFLKITPATYMLGLIIIVLMIDRCSIRNRLEQNLSDILSYSDSVRYFVGKYSKDSIAFNEALDLSSRMFNDVIVSKNRELAKLSAELRRVSSATVVRTVTRIDSVTVPLIVDVPCDSFHAEYDIDSTYYHVSGYVNERMLGVRSITIPDEQNIAVGYKRKNLFSKAEHIVTISHTNPYVRTTGLQSYTIKGRSRLIDRWWVKAGVGAVLGYSLKYIF